jgi:hypothetical protein
MRKYFVVSVSILCLSFAQTPIYAIGPVSISPQIAIVDTGNSGGYSDVSTPGIKVPNSCGYSSFSEACLIGKR